ncbi:hypothetical protein ACFYPA_28865 [Streptomyces sp. NPDC005775]|uniref:hypothetical protein n=1 Tax=unclassified Streptomyces TaxID=2593676 RepID=UPI0033CACB42
MEHLAPNPVVTLNRQAVATVHGPTAGPDLLATLDSDWRTAPHTTVACSQSAPISWNNSATTRRRPTPTVRRLDAPAAHRSDATSPPAWPASPWLD